MKMMLKKMFRNLVIVTVLLVLSVSVSAQMPPTEQTNVISYPNVVAWGDNTFTECNVPSNLTNAVAVAAGYHFSVALCSDGSLVGWGENYNGQLSFPSNTTDVVAIAAGTYCTMLLHANGTVSVCGNGGNVPLDLTNAVAIAGGLGFCLALKADGTVVAWGDDRQGQCDIPAGLTNVISISAGDSQGIALCSDGSVIGWGTSQLDDLDIPTDLTDVIAVGAGGVDTILLHNTGNVTVVGGNGIVPTLNPPPSNTTNVIAVSAGYLQNVALCVGGTIITWGNNRYGQGITPNLIAHVIATSAGESHNLALLDLTQPFPPIITTSPTTQTASSGSTVELSVRVLGLPPLTYQWYFGTNAIDGATNVTLTLANVTSAQSGEYHVVVTNPGGSTTSADATLNVVPTLGIVMVPTVIVIGDVGSTYTLQYINAFGPTNAWNDLATVTVTNNPEYYFDLSAIGQPTRFYRLGWTP